MREEDLRILLKDRGDRDHRDVVGYRVEGLQRVRAHEEIEFARDQLDPVVDVRATGNDFDVETVTRVSAVRDGLIESAMFGLRDPVGTERHLVEAGRGLRMSRSAHRQNRNDGNCAQQPAGWHDWTP